MSEPAKLPHGWASVPVGEICRILAGYGFPLHLQGRATGEFPFFKVGDISDAWKAGETFLSHARHYLSREDALELGANPFPTGTVVFAKIGAAIALNRRAILKQPSLIDNNVMGLFPTASALDSRFLFYWTCTIGLDQYSRATTVPSIRKSDVADIAIPVPPLPEQHRIVSEIEKHFTRLTSALESLRQLQTSLKRHRAAILKAAVEGRLVPTEAELARAEGWGYEPAENLLKTILENRGQEFPKEKPYAHREGWIEATIEQLASVGTGATPLRSNVSFYRDGMIPWITSGALNNALVKESREFVTEKALRETNLTIYPKGTLLVAMYGEGRTRGKCSELMIEACTNQAIAAIVTTDLAGECRPYLKLFLEKNYEDLRRLASGGVQPNLNLSLIKALRVPLPPLAEQRRITAEAERILSVAEKTESIVLESLKRAETLRAQILTQAFCGKLVPQLDGDEPASTLLEEIRQSREGAAENRHRRGRRVKPEVSIPGPAIEIPHPRPQALPLPQTGTRNVKSEGTTDEGKVPPHRQPDFLALPRTEQIDHVWKSLLGHGPLDKDAAIRTAAQSLRDQGLARFQRLREGGPLYEAIAAALDRGVREGSFDRPKRGHVRAVLPDAKDCTSEEWKLCLLQSLDGEPTSQDDALRTAAEWARETLGLDFARLREDGVILSGLKAALDEAVKTGEVVRRRGAVSLPVTQT